MFAMRRQGRRLWCQNPTITLAMTCQRQQHAYVYTSRASVCTFGRALCSASPTSEQSSSERVAAFNEWQRANSVALARRVVVSTDQYERYLDEKKLRTLSQKMENLVDAGTDSVDPEQQLQWDIFQRDDHNADDNQASASASDIVTPEDISVIDYRKEPTLYYRNRHTCFFCRPDESPNKHKALVYTNVELLQRFINERGMISSRVNNQLCAKHQRNLARVIKRARNVGLLSFLGNHPINPRWRPGLDIYDLELEDAFGESDDVQKNEAEESVVFADTSSTSNSRKAEKAKADREWAVLQSAWSTVDFGEQALESEVTSGTSSSTTGNNAARATDKQRETKKRQMREDKQQREFLAAQTMFKKRTDE